MTDDPGRALRAAAPAGEWEHTRRVLAETVARLPSAEALALAADFLTERLPLLERVRPGDHWGRRALADEAVGPPDEYAGPGANNLVKGIEHLISARRVDDPERRLRHVVDSLCEAVMATVVAVWGATHPVEWAGWYARATSPIDDQPTEPIDFRRDGPARELERAQWDDLADRLTALR